ncbi:MAG: response regulator [Thermodesulfobacteriota bacterium]|jgi:signal transduction histidine kinase
MEALRRSILVVDDDPGFREMITKFLQDKGFQAASASNGNRAIENVLSGFPELVLLDLKLPDMTGVEVLKRIKEINEDIAVVIVTGYGGEQVAVDLIKAGALDYISKPFEFEALLTSIKNSLKIREAQIEDKRNRRFSSLERFFPFLAHEVRNPLHAIAGAIAIIERRSNSSDELLAQSIRIIQEEVHHLNEFVQECLDFVRPPRTGFSVEVDINEVISIVIRILSHMFEKTFGTIKIVMETDPTLPRVTANYEEIKQAFLNIIKNSLEAMPNGGELVVKTCLRSDLRPRCIEISFIDNGIGIKKEDMASLFNAFFTTKLRGTGLGLAICHRIVIERHNGEMGIKSEIGKGTAVTVRLPLEEKRG